MPDRFFSRQLPTPVRKPALIKVNQQLARQLGIDPDWLESDGGVKVISGNQVPEGADPIATVYAGHQFGSWNPQLGDGRAVLLGEVIGSDGNRYDIQLKGGGQTPYSRMGDGRAPLGPVLREYIVSEAMAALGIPTTRALAAVTTGEDVYREKYLPGGIIARVAKSHIRIGTLQYFAAQNDIEGLGLLVEHIIARHYPEAAGSSNPVLTMYESALSKQASLVAKWQMAGFIHGVMNTDNMLMSGETIDYGPCAFMDTYDPDTVFSSIDQNGRYAYCNQPGIAHWNLACLGQALIPLLDDNRDIATGLAKEVLDGFPECFFHEYMSGLRNKLGFSTACNDDETLAKDFLNLLAKNQCDFTLAFRRLTELAGDTSHSCTNAYFEFPPEFAPWLDRWAAHHSTEDISRTERHSSMSKVNPVIIPRNHIIEQAISSAYDGDFSLFHQLSDKLSSPFNDIGENEKIARPPSLDQIVHKTFCGT